MTKLDSFLDEVEEISEYGPVINREAETAFVNYMRNTVPTIEDVRKWATLAFDEAFSLVRHLELKLENDKVNNYLIWEDIDYTVDKINPCYDINKAHNLYKLSQKKDLPLMKVALDRLKPCTLHEINVPYIESRNNDYHE